MKAIKRFTAAAMAAAMSMTMGITCYAGEWKDTDNGKMYLDDNGDHVTGKQEIDGETYYFNGRGILKTGWLKTKGGRKYYFDKETGAMRTGWMKATSGKYYFGKNGLAVTGEKKIDGKWYCFNDEGVMQTGWQNGCFYMDNGRKAVNTSLTIDGVKYRFDREGGYTEVSDRPSAAKRTEKEPVYPTSISATTDVIPLRKGDHTFVTYNFKPLNTNVTDVTFSTSNKNVVTIDKQGEMYGVDNGTCTITITCVHDTSMRATVKVKVTDN